MEPILVLLGSWWWVAPAAAGAGVASYSMLTSGRRRARRLELEAARHEEAQAYRALVAARGRVRSARADVLVARSRGPVTAAQLEARQALQLAKQAEKSASLALRASRSRVKAAWDGLRARSADTPLPLEALMGEHDAVRARWLEYETDAAKALAYPRMIDAQYPTTHAFLRAMRDAGDLRPASTTAKITPARYVEYRDAVRRLEVAFAEAERAAGARAALPRPTPWPVPGWWGAAADPR
ncbi:hypothetical protein GCM10022200_20440 [Microbacterium awajiense]|uniref:Secreted protein n=1 Tax=Microbacterium awajiense TaxID=415214 RepID=A0ABP7APA9_9MICO